MVKMMLLSALVAFRSVFGAAPDTSWTLAVSETPAAITVDNTGNTYSAWASGNTFQCRKISTTGATLWQESFNLGAATSVKDIALLGSNVLVLGKTGASAALLKVSGTTGDSVSIQKASTSHYSSSEGYRLIVDGSDYYILGTCSRLLYTPHTTTHIEMWTNSLDIVDSKDLGSSTDDAYIHDFKATSNGFAVLITKTGTLKLCSYDTNKNLRWSDDVISNPYLAFLELKNDTPFVYHNLGSTELTAHRVKYNGLITASSAPTKTSSTFLEDAIIVSTTSDDDGVFMGINTIPTGYDCGKVYRTDFWDSLWVKDLSTVMDSAWPVYGNNIAVRSGARATVGMGKRYVQLRSEEMTAPTISGVSEGWSISTQTVNSAYSFSWSATDASGIASRSVQLYDGSWSEISTSEGTINWTPTTAGDYKLRIIATDIYENADTVTSAQFSAYNLPTVTVTSPSGTIGETQNYTISWSSNYETSTTIDTSFDNGPWGTISVSSGDTRTAVSAGTLRIRVSVSNQVGSASDTSTLTIEAAPDNTNPTVSITTPGNLPVHTAASISFSSSDAGGISSQSLWKYNGSYTKIADLSPTATSYDWTPGLIDTAVTKLKLVAQDVAGNSNEQETGAFSVTYTATDLNITTTAGTIYLNAPKTIEWELTGNVGVMQQGIEINLDKYGTPAYVWDIVDINQQYYTWTPNTIGNNTVGISFRDSITLIWASPDYVSFTVVDSSTPTVALSGNDTTDLNTAVTVSWTVNPSTVELSGQTLTVNGSSVSGITASDRSYDFTPTEYGIYTIRVTATNTNGGASSYDEHVVYCPDPTAPVVNLSAATHTSPNTVVPVTWTVSPEDLSAQTLSINGSDVSGIDIYSRSYGFSNPEYGTYVLRVTATNANGGSSGYDEHTISILDSSAPVIVLSGASQVASGTSTTLSWTVTPSTVTLGTQSLSIDGSNVSGITTSSRSYDFSSSTPGTYTIRVTAANTHGGASSYDEHTITVVDADMPAVTVTAPNGGELLEAGSQQNITWTASDNVGVTRRVIAMSADSGQNWTQVSDETANTGTYAWTLPTDVSSKVLVKVTVYDEAGNSTSDVSDATFYIIDDPVFTSADTASATESADLMYLITYDFPGNPPSVTQTVLSKPDWVSVSNDTISGTPPAENRVDTVKVMVSAGGLSDTLNLVITVTYTTTGINGRIHAQRDLFGIKVSHGRIQYGINSGHYRVRVFNMAGRIVFSENGLADAGKISDVIPMGRTAYIINLKQGERVLTKKVMLVR